MNSFVQWLLTKTSFPLYINTLPNPDNPEKDLNERNVHTRDADHIEKFIEKHNVPGRGVFFCVGMFPENKRRGKNNIVEAPFLHIDVDSKDIDISLDRVQEILLRAKHPPTLIVSSGRGIHAYWLLREPTKNLVDLETALKGLVRIYAGDPVVTHSAALMRLPGTVNSKDGGHREVQILHQNNNAYRFDVLCNWIKLEERAIPRKGEDNVVDFSSFQVRPPVDIEGRLAAMSYRGVGETSVHATQLSVTAAMLNAGVSIDEVVAKVLSATKAAVSENWDWGAEETTIRNMCTTWIEKHGRQPVAQLINLEESKAEKATKAKKKSKEEFYLEIARETMEYTRKLGERFLFVKAEPFHYSGEIWTRLSNHSEISSVIARRIQAYCSSKGTLTSNRMVSEIKRLILDGLIPQVDFVSWDVTGFIPFKNGLLDYGTGELSSHRPENYLTRRIDREYEPSADCPFWKQMLADAFPGEPEVVNVLQEIAGAGLLSQKSRSITTAMVLVGPAASGKSSILEVLGKIYSDNRVSTPIDQLEKAHGTMGFLTQYPWVLDEAFDSSTWHTSKTIKALLTGETIDVNIKNGPLTTIQFKSPIFWGANVMPQFKEMTEAIKKRLTVIRCNQIFDMKKPIGVAKEARERGYWTPAELVVEEEIAGVINWALEGLKRAIARGSFPSVSSVEEAADMIHESGNYAIEFLRDCTEPDPNVMISTTDLWGAFSVWWFENRGESGHVPSQRAMISAISSLHRKDIKKSPERFNAFNYILGMKFSLPGFEYWESARNEAEYKNLARRYTQDPEKISVPIPPKWGHIIGNVSEDKNGA